MSTGTSHFRDRAAAVRYYEPQEGEHAAAYVDDALQEERIHIGPPARPSWGYILEDENGRFHVRAIPHDGPRGVSPPCRRQEQRRQDTTTGPPAVVWFSIPGADPRATSYGTRIDHPERRTGEERRRRP